MTTVGFKLARFGIFDPTDETKVTKTFLVDGKNRKGGTVEADISGLDVEAVKSYASDGPYYVSKSGVGDVKQTISLLEPEADLEQALLGRVKGEDGIVRIGRSTRPPYASCVMESETLDGKPVFLALLKGKYGQDDMKLATKEDKLPEPEATQYTGDFVYNNDGDVMLVAIGEEFREKVYKEAFPGYEETPAVPEG